MFLLSPAATFITGSTLRIDGARPQCACWPMKIAQSDAQQREAIQPSTGSTALSSLRSFLFEGQQFTMNYTHEHLEPENTKRFIDAEINPHVHE